MGDSFLICCIITISVHLFSSLDTEMASFTQLLDTTPENSATYLADFSAAVRPDQRADRMFALLDSLKGGKPSEPVDLYHHNIQTATRAYRAGEDTELVVCALFHDVGEFLSPVCHGEIAASILRPYISEKSYWVLQHHEIFQTHYYGSAWGVDPDLREEFSSSPHYEDCVRFCRDYDQAAFDPAYDNMDVKEFYPLVLEVFSRPPYSATTNLDTISRNKKRICY